MSDPDQSGGSWTLLTGHGRVLVEIARNPGARIRDISAAAGLTERTVQAIVADLEAAGYLTRTRTGRRDPVHRQPRQRVPAPRPGRTPGRPVPQPARRRPSEDARSHTEDRMTVRWGASRRYACASAGVLSRTRRRSIYDSRDRVAGFAEPGDHGHPSVPARNGGPGSAGTSSC